MHARKTSNVEISSCIVHSWGRGDYMYGTTFWKIISFDPRGGLFFELELVFGAYLEMRKKVPRMNSLVNFRGMMMTIVDCKECQG